MRYSASDSDMKIAIPLNRNGAHDSHARNNHVTIIFAPAPFDRQSDKREEMRMLYDSLKNFTFL